MKKIRVIIMLEWIALGAAMLIATWASSENERTNETKNEEDKIILEMENGSIREFEV